MAPRFVEVHLGECGENDVTILHVGHANRTMVHTDNANHVCVCMGCMCVRIVGGGFRQGCDCQIQCVLAVPHYSAEKRLSRSQQLHQALVSARPVPLAFRAVGGTAEETFPTTMHAVHTDM
jgi:hypothetical protein